MLKRHKLWICPLFIPDDLEGVVGAVGKISAFRQQGPHVDPRLCYKYIFEYLCDLFFRLS